MGDRRKFVKRMSKLLEKKQNELNRRGKRANELLQRSDDVYSKNKEQWEAYCKCIEFQHDMMIGLIQELFVIRNFLERVQAYQGETTDDNSSSS